MFIIDGLLNGNGMNYIEALSLIKADYQRYATNSQGGGNLLSICRMALRNRGFAYSLWLRLSAVKGLLWPLAKIVHHHLSTKYRVTIQSHTVIGGGLYFPNCWNIVINPSCVIGGNVTISEFVNIGSNDGKSSTIGDNTVIYPRVCIVGSIVIGNNSVLRAGSVVTRDVEPFIVVEGSPAKKIGIDQ